MADPSVSRSMVPAPLGANFVSGVQFPRLAFAGAIVVKSEAVLLFALASPPPATLAMLVTEATPVLATLTVNVITA